MKRLLLITLVMALHGIAYGDGQERGNGGDGVLCESPTFPHNKTVELFDYYEGRVKRGLQVNLGDKNMSPGDKVQLALSRLKKLNPHRYELYQKWAQDFFSETKFVQDETLPDIPDAGAIAIPKNCHLVQVAVQETPSLPGDSRYVIDQSLWDMMDNDSKAGLVLHEIILREAVFVRRHSGSKFARYFNQVLSINQAESNLI